MKPEALLQLENLSKILQGNYSDSIKLEVSREIIKHETEIHKHTSATHEIFGVAYCQMANVENISTEERINFLLKSEDHHKQTDWTREHFYNLVLIKSHFIKIYITKKEITKAVEQINQLKDIMDLAKKNFHDSTELKILAIKPLDDLLWHFRSISLQTQENILLQMKSYAVNLDDNAEVQIILADAMRAVADGYNGPKTKEIELQLYNEALEKLKNVQEEDRSNRYYIVLCLLASNMSTSLTNTSKRIELYQKVIDAYSKIKNPSQTHKEIYAEAILYLNRDSFYSPDYLKFFKEIADQPELQRTLQQLSDISTKCRSKLQESNREESLQSIVKSINTAEDELKNAKRKFAIYLGRRPSFFEEIKITRKDLEHTSPSPQV